MTRREKVQLRERDPMKVRLDAIKMAGKKFDSGCISCAESYLEVARRHGATDEDLAASLRVPALGTPGKASSPKSSATVSPPYEKPVSEGPDRETARSNRIA